MVMNDIPLSEHLLNKPEFQEGILPGAQTKLYIVELWHFGNSFVFQLKNGHFIISDGGTEHELPYLLAELRLKARDVVCSMQEVFGFFDKIQVKFDSLRSYLRKRI